MFPTFVTTQIMSGAGARACGALEATCRCALLVPEDVKPELDVQQIRTRKFGHLGS